MYYVYHATNDVYFNNHPLKLKQPKSNLIYVQVILMYAIHSVTECIKYLNLNIMKQNMCNDTLNKSYNNSNQI